MLLIVSSKMRTTNLLYTLLLSLLMVSCSGLSTPFKKMEGKWTAGGDQGDGHSWYMEYTFTGNKYSMTGYPPISESGKMELKVANGDSLLIGFKVIKSDPEYKDHDEWVVIKGDELMLSGMMFHKQIEKKQK